MTSYDVAEAKAHLSRLLDAAEAGEAGEAGEAITLSRSGRPVADPVPVTAPPKRKLGFFPLETPDDRFDPLSDDVGLPQLW